MLNTLFALDETGGNRANRNTSKNPDYFVHKF
jgi:hypothetical protein